MAFLLVLGTECDRHLRGDGHILFHLFLEVLITKQETLILVQWAKIF